VGVFGYQAAISRNRYGVEKTVDTHKILMNAIKIYVCLQEIRDKTMTKVVSLNPVHGKMYLIQHYVIKFVSDLRQVGGFLRVLRFASPIKLTTTM
jgi:hypothetical protein